MEHQDLLTICHVLREMILELVLVTEDNNISFSPTHPNFAQLSLVFKGLQEIQRISFKKNTFNFEVGNLYLWNRVPAMLNPDFLTTPYGSTPTKKLIERLEFQFFKPRYYSSLPRHDLFTSPSFNWPIPWKIVMFYSNNAFKGLINSLPLLPNFKEVTLIFKIPSYFQLCERHFVYPNTGYEFMTPYYKRSHHAWHGECRPYPLPDDTTGRYSFDPTALFRLYKLIKGLHQKAPVRISWEVFNRVDLDENRTDTDPLIYCDWENLQFLRAIIEMKGHGYKSPELQHWYQTLQVSSNIPKSEELQLWHETMKIPGGLLI